MPAGEFEMLGLERGHSDLTASDSFLFERKKRKEERSCGDRRASEHVATLFRRGYLSSWNRVKWDLEGYGTILALANLLDFIFVWGKNGEGRKI